MYCIISFTWIIISRPTVQAAPGTVALYAAKAQTQPEAAHPLHHPAAQLPREEVPGEAVPLYLGAGRILQPAQAHRDSGQDLVSESKVRNITVFSVLMLLVIFDIYIINRAAWQPDLGSPDRIL